MHMESLAPSFRGARAFGRRALLVGLLALGALAGCKRNDTGQLPEASGEAVQAQRQEVVGFGLASAYPDQHDGSLAIALEFSRPLVSSQDFDQLLAVAGANGETVKGSWVLDDKGRILRFPSVEAAKDYDVTVRADLLAADGSRLGKELKQRVHTGELDPAVGFASQGSVLPARESRGLPVVSINVKEVDVEFLRVNEKSLPKFFSEYQRGGRRGSWDLDSDYGDSTPTA